MSTSNFSPRFSHKMACSALALMLSVSFAGSLHAGAREQAKRIHDRIAGVPPSDTVLTAMEADITGGNANDAALRALANPDFYRVTLKNFITPWTNEAQTVFAPLNDYSATLIGIIRDDLDFRTILYDDILYTGPSPSGLATSNAHYKALEDTGADLSNPAVLIKTSQTAFAPTIAPAGILTTRAAARAFFVDGTNRAMFRFTLLNHLCEDMEQLKDPSYPADRIRQDVSRSPGGDSRIYMNACIGCHTGMDPMTQSMAYYDFEYPLDGNGDPNFDAGQLVYNAVGSIDTDKNGQPTGTRVQAKYLQNNNTFEYGYITPDDNWDNYWRVGSNSALGWDTALSGSGSGASSLGQELAHSEAFARCQVEKVFKAVCLRTPVDASDRGQIDTMISAFKGNGYKLKQVFADSAVFCMGS
jgi:Protein of unknown function (DUF1585)